MLLLYIETAINIGYSCKLLTDEMEEVFVIDGEEHEDVKRQLTDARDKMLDIRKQQHVTEDINGGAMEVRIYCRRERFLSVFSRKLVCSLMCAECVCV